MDKSLHMVDVARFPVAEELVGAYIVRRVAAVEIHDAHPFGIAGRFDNGGAFFYGVADGFFQKNMRPGLQCLNGGQGMPMVGRGDNDNVGLFLAQAFAKIGIGLGLVVTPFVHLGAGMCQLVLVHIAQGRNAHFSGSDTFSEDIKSPPTAADEHSFVLLLGQISQKWASGHPCGGKRGLL